MFLEPALLATACSRFEEVSRFSALLGQSGHYPCVIDLAGERWSGKTTMLGDFAVIAMNAGWQVLRGSTTLSPAGLPLGVFADALDDLVHGTDLASHLMEADRQRLARVFPALDATTDGPAPLSESETYYVFVAMRRLLEAIDSGEGLLLLLDDMHLADAASVDLLGYLISHHLKATLCVVVSHRPQQSGAELLMLLREGAVQGRVHQIPVGPLSRQSALALLPADLSDTRRETLIDHAAGNAGLLCAVGELRGLPQRPDGTPVELPSWLLDRCVTEFHRLSEKGQRAVNAAAVLDAPFTLKALMAVAQLDEARLQDVIDELAMAHILEFVGTVRMWRFTDSALRAAAYQSAPPGWLLSAHARVLEVLDAQGAPAESLARHLGNVSQIDASRVSVLVDAARSHLWTDPAQAASWCAAAAELSGSLTELTPEQRLLYGKTLALAGPLDQALEVLEGVEQEGPPQGRLTAEAARWRAWVWSLLGDVDMGRKVVLSAMQSADTETFVLLDEMLLMLDLYTSEDLTRYEQARWPAASGHGRAMLAAAAMRRGDRSTAEAHIEHARPLLAELPETELAGYLYGLYWLAEAEARFGRTELAMGHLREGLRVAEDRRILSCTLHFALASAALLLRKGDAAGAARHAGYARSIGESIGSRYLADLAATIERPVGQAAAQPAGVGSRLEDQDTQSTSVACLK